jgi:hypothetical protein
MQAKKKEPEIREKLIKKAPEKRAESSRLSPSLRPHVNTINIQKRSCAPLCSVTEHSQKEFYETNASAAETHAGMNRSTNPPHGGEDSSAAAATRQIHE